MRGFTSLLVLSSSPACFNAATCESVIVAVVDFVMMVMMVLLVLCRQSMEMVHVFIMMSLLLLLF